MEEERAFGEAVFSGEVLEGFVWGAAIVRCEVGDGIRVKPGRDQN